MNELTKQLSFFYIDVTDEDGMIDKLLAIDRIKTELPVCLNCLFPGVNLILKFLIRHTDAALKHLM